MTEKLEDLAQRLVADAQRMTLQETLTMAVMHVVQVADAVDYRGLAMYMCNGHKTPEGHRIVHADVLFRANTPRDAVEILWMIVDGMASSALASPALNPVAGPLYELRKHLEDTFGLANMRTEDTQVIAATGIHEIPDMDRMKAN